MIKLPYSQETQDLIDRICRDVERENFELDKKNGAECILKTYDLFGLRRPKKVVWFKDIFDKKWIESARNAWNAWSARNAWNAGSAWSARSARSAGSTRSAGNARNAWNARSTWSTRSARSAWSIGSAGSAWSAGGAWSTGSTWSTRSAIDYDFDWYIFEFEYCKNPIDNPPNENDKKYLDYCELLIQAKEYGVGYRIEWKDVLYLVPIPLIKIDERNRFHSLIMPAIQWKEGAKLYFIHGVRVNEKIIKTPELLTIDDWKNEKNLEVRRIIQERMPDFVTKLHAKEIESFRDYTLYEVDISPDPEKIAKYLKMKDNSTARIYYLRVPPKFNNIPDALAWTWGLTKEEYKPLIET
jgi:hypothetical protein